jgi:hypothetical protein
MDLGAGNIADHGDMDFDNFGGRNLNDAGTWSSSVSGVPEPGSLMLVGALGGDCSGAELRLRLRRCRSG